MSDNVADAPAWIKAMRAVIRASAIIRFSLNRNGVSDDEHHLTSATGTATFC
jgi:hypothetical protein